MANKRTKRQRVSWADEVPVVIPLAQPPAYGCFTCQCRRYWLRPDGSEYVCAWCHPPPDGVDVKFVITAPAKQIVPLATWLQVPPRPYARRV
jgi:hypothetical protein